MGAEGILTGFVVAFLVRVYPAIFARATAVSTEAVE
jgi:hypothetical protein